METQRMKLDYNNLIRTISETMSRSRSKTVRQNAFGIEIGLEMLSKYLEAIAKRAIELNDEVLLGLLVDMMILKKVDESGAE